MTNRVRKTSLAAQAKNQPVISRDLRPATQATRVVPEAVRHIAGRGAIGLAQRFMQRDLTTPRDKDYGVDEFLGTDVGPDDLRQAR